MPPEQTIGVPGTIDAQSDVFALGALLYHVVVGRPPYVGHDASAVLVAARDVQFVPPEQAAPEGVVSPGIARVIKRAMSREKADRHADVRELKHDLQRAVRGGTHLPSRWYPAGHVFCREGDVGSEAYVIAQGRCVAHRTGPDGARQVLREMGPGAVFGEMAVISDVLRTATVEALEPVLVQVVSKDLLEDELGLDAWVGAFVRALAQRFRDLEDQFRGPRSLPPRGPLRGGDVERGPAPRSGSGETPG
jgi:CRP-like cAMP-binding protein